MTISIDWENQVINIEKEDMELIQYAPVEIRELDINDLHITLRDLEDSEEGMCFPYTHNHTPPTTLGDESTERVLEIINDYTITFENELYVVNVVGGYNNVEDVVNGNQVLMGFDPVIRVYPHLSPRIIEVIPPTYDITVQQIYNKIREWEEQPANMSYPHLIMAGGKENLGGGVEVGITATLQNARLMFTGRTTPLVGVGTCTTGDSEGLTLIASGETFITDRVYEGCTVYNITTSSMAAITEVVSETQLRHFVLSGGSRSSWEIGDEFYVYPNVQCSITGGNLVAIDENGDKIDEVFQSPNVQVVRSSSSSATALQQEALQYASYQGAVWIDIVSGTAGTDFPVGTRQYPVNNVIDGLIIATTVGLGTFQCLSDITIDSSVDITGFKFIGESPIETNITLGTLAACPEIVIESARITGVLDGGSYVRNCTVDNIEYVNGYICSCGLKGEITLGGDADTVFCDCGWIDLADPPVINMGGSGRDCIISNFHGDITVTNLTGANTLRLQLTCGKVTIDSSVTAGTIDVGGIGQVIDNSTGSATVINRTLPFAIWEELVANHNLPGSMGANQIPGVISWGS